MSAKILQALTDENPDLRKQIGCMTGIFQLFDRHHFLTAKRLNGQNHKRVPSGHSHVNSGNFGAEAITCSPQKETEKSLSKNPNENQPTSFESSRASLSSSSCSSPFSSLDCNKTTQPEAYSFERTNFSEHSLGNPQKLQNPNVDSGSNNYAQSGQQSLDIRDIVKDSIYRETRGLSVKTASRDEMVNHNLKHGDSPRPLNLSKSLDGSNVVGTNGKPRMPVDINESLRVLSKLKEAPWYFSKAREPSRSLCDAKDASLFSGSKDAPRFSYDGREIPRSSFDSRDTYKSTTKLRELPRLSLDSRECSMRSSNLDSKPNPILNEPRRSNSDQNNSNNGALSPQELGSYKRPPSVVVKLMGLETLPNSSSEEDCDLYFGARNSNSSRLSKLTEESKQDRMSRSPKSSLKDPVLPQLRNPHSVTKPISASRFPIETAPWRQQDTGRSTQKTAFKNREAHARSSTSQSVYSEIETRLKELEFQPSNKDLRALKQILDAMQAKGLLETRKGEDQTSHIMIQKNSSSHDQTGPPQNVRSANRRNPPNNSRSISAPIIGNSSPRAFESPIVIMKPAKFIDRSSSSDGLSGLRKFRNGDSVDSKKILVNNRAVGMDTNPKLSLKEPANQILTTSEKKNRGRSEDKSSQKPRLRPIQSSSTTQHLPRENSGNPARISGSLSPRTQQNKLDLEKRSRPPIPLSDSSKPTRQSVRQQTELGSPGGKHRLRSAHVQPADDQSSEISSGTRSFSHQGDEISLQSDSNISLASQTDIEVTSAYQSSEMYCPFFQQGIQSPSGKVGNNTVSRSRQKKSLSSLSEDGLSAEFTIVAPEQPSPVSVLDASFYRDDLLPSPVNKISNGFKDDETRNPDNTCGEDGWNRMGLDRLSDNTPANFSSEIDQKKLENIEHLVQKLRGLNSSHDEATTDYIASLCENTSPDHRYVSEILLASGLLLRDLASSPTPIQLHPSGHPINPDLFFVLEQTKANRPSKSEPKYKNDLQLKPDREKLHRKLVFDSVNEILIRKLVLPSQTEPWLQPEKLTGASTPSGQKLLRELCSEIDRLQAYRSEGGHEEDDDGFRSILREDLMRRVESWKDFRREISGVVLDIERLIFKDLVDEIVNGEPSTQRAKPSRRRRQLFVK
ncbi:protein LONGIFOLIA 1-like [Tasmannia lanceolata]|uniref:protein LONGIFOLIA 1-like n=1 Tax=Tasmannia lanceolata TaxID=3420 RepID=UPI004062BD45